MTPDMYLDVPLHTTNDVTKEEKIERYGNTRQHIKRYV